MTPVFFENRSAARSRQRSGVNGTFLVALRNLNAESDFLSPDLPYPIYSAPFLARREQEIDRRRKDLTPCVEHAMLRA
jgi:hypothetical protein